jgi:hypothetical protein
MNSIMRTIGGAIGAQVAAALVTTKTLPGSTVPQESAFTVALAVAAVAALLALAPVWALRRRQQSRASRLRPLANPA